MKYEYLLHTWGGFYNKEHQQKHGREKGYFFFNSEEAREAYIQKLKEIENDLDAHSLVCKKYEGKDVRFETVIKLTFKYKDEIYKYKHNFGYAFPESTAVYMFTEGNYACDCNRSDLIGVDNLDCGNEIELIDYKIVKREGTEEQYAY